ncbi:MAG: Gfo/Idh/MocA family oxidoreductase [Ignavibacteriae bacterium]|nr:Gfo/Idh/MocA family oxidoreductase [Ignavibacteriota bacterium]MCB9208802.1 Gfo/Idh/MocA family oxidoreductase [Ignavibacteriales bacterium]MCB9218280.1 Gfo/Idh/MocA family oxidoreductase [Ignavibacteriales bacterium]MCB9260575.1 Gfo/Idh/MocA family oxidoreductase [Ignavibacteriales bacterium]
MATAAFTILPRHVLGGKGFVAPSDKLNIACIGIGGKGETDAEAMENENVVALCDVDEIRGAKTREKYPNARFYDDFRVLLDKEKNVDALTISTPDHTHAIIALSAIQLGKHVYVQKPLTHTVYEARKLAEAAKRYNVVTQMGNQGHAGEGARLVNEWIADGAIGDVKEVHTWTNRPIWPQGIEKPEEIPSLPNFLNWNLWLGPAPYRDYHPAYHPFSWRGWWDFGTGALGDMGAHILDQPFWALNLDFPDTIQASSSEFNDQTYPVSSIVTWTFPEKDGRAPVKIVWYDGGLLPPRPEDLEPGRKLGACIYYGTEGKLMHDNYGDSPRLIPETAMQDFDMPEKTIPRSPGIYEEWLEAIKNGTKSTTDFEYSAKLTETMLLGNVAIKMKEKNTILEYDGKKGEFTNMDEANELLTKKYPKGWEM